jgi:small-conductance mechanosensitive channel
MSESGATPSDLLPERAEQSRMKLWFLLEADRWFVTGVLLAIVCVTMVAVGYFYPTAETAIRTTDSVDTLFQGLLTATITGVTLVLSLNQLVLSQELGAVGDHRKRMEEAMQFRRDAADIIQTPVSPSRPAQLLQALVQISGDRAEKLRDGVPETVESAFLMGLRRTRWLS